VPTLVHFRLQRGAAVVIAGVVVAAAAVVAVLTGEHQPSCNRLFNERLAYNFSFMLERKKYD